MGDYIGQLTRPRKIVKSNKGFAEGIVKVLNMTMGEVWPMVKIKEAQNSFKVSGRGLRIALLDTGIDKSQKHFIGKSIIEFDIHHKSCPAPDKLGHGTHVAGIICAPKEYLGIAPDADLAMVKILNDDNWGARRHILEGLQWVRGHWLDFHGITAICVCLSDRHNWANDDGYSLIKNEIKELYQMNIPVITGSGNCYYANGCVEGMANPGIISHTISVGALYDSASEEGMQYPDCAEDKGAITCAKDFKRELGRIAPFSQRLLDDASPCRTDIFAPGVDVTVPAEDSDRDPTDTQRGTSQATAVVAGVVLLLQHLYRKRTRSTKLPPIDLLVECLRAGGEDRVDNNHGDDNAVHTGKPYKVLNAYGALAYMDSHV